MKIISNRRYRSLLNFEKNNAADVFEISSLFEIAHKLFSENPENNIESFEKNLNELALFISKVLKYDISLFGYKDDNELIDLSVFYQGSKVTNRNIEKLKRISLKESLVGRVISETNKAYLFSNTRDDIFKNFKEFSKKYPELLLTPESHKNISEFFSFTNETLKNLVICPITPTNIDQSNSYGYLVLANKVDFVEKDEQIKIEILRNYLYPIFKNQTGLINQNRDKEFISDIYRSHFKYGIEEILRYLVVEFGFFYSSFWVPTKEENEVAFGLKKCFLNKYDKTLKRECEVFDFYTSDEIILGKIYSKEEMPNFLGEYYLFDDLTKTKTGFNCSHKLFADKSLLIIPITKYIHQDDIDGFTNNDLGYFCFYLNKQSIFRKYYFNRLNIFIQQISFYIEHILYDLSFHNNKRLKENFFDLNSSTPKTYYQDLADYVNNIMNSEHTSIYFINRSDELYLKASTAKIFLEINNENKLEKEIVSEINLQEVLNNENFPVYKTEKSITYRSYKSRKVLMVHDVHSDKVDSDLSFYEKTKTYHKSIIVAPIIVDDECIGVIKCVNKIELDDSFLKIFSNHDFETISMLGKFISNQYLNIVSVENRMLFLEKLSHENKTPIGVIWGAIENIQFKLEEKNNYNDETLKSNFENIAYATSIINNNYSNLSTVLRNQDNKLNFHFEIFDLKDKIEEVTNFLKPLLQKEENKTVNVEHHLSKMPKISVDKSKMYQVIFNLLSNAVRYCDKASKVETYFNENPKFPYEEYFEIQFVNYGIGVLKEDADRIFNAYYRSSNAKSVNPNGTGIGLYVSKTIINAHNGIIEVSKLENPTIFSVYLPKTIILT